MDGLNKVLDKLGIYDLNAVLLPGIIAWSFTIVFLCCCFSVDIQDSMVVSNVVFFLSISYFVGLILQEIGSIILKLVDAKSNLLLQHALVTDKKSHRFLTKREKKGISEYSKIDIEKDSSGCFEHCRNYLLVAGEYSGLDKDRTLAAFSRSMAVFCAWLLIVLIVSGLLNAVKLSVFWVIMVIVVLIVLLCVFIWRCYRLSVSWHINIMKRFYYYHLYLNEKTASSTPDNNEKPALDLSGQNEKKVTSPYSANAHEVFW